MSNTKSSSSAVASAKAFRRLARRSGARPHGVGASAEVGVDFDPERTKMVKMPKVSDAFEAKDRSVGAKGKASGGRKQLTP